MIHPRTTAAAKAILESLRNCKSGDDFKLAEQAMTKSLLELSKQLETENQSLRKSHAELELKCALANAQVHNLKAALEKISRLSSVTCLTFEDQSFHATEIAREALKGSTCA